MSKSFDVIVIGAGHAGVEAALRCGTPWAASGTLYVIA